MFIEVAVGGMKCLINPDHYEFCEYAGRAHGRHDLTGTTVDLGLSWDQLIVTLKGGGAKVAQVVDAQ